MRELSINQLPEAAKTLRAGERILLSGVIYTARDAAHKRMFELLDMGEALSRQGLHGRLGGQRQLDQSDGAPPAQAGRSLARKAVIP